MIPVEGQADARHERADRGGARRVAPEAEFAEVVAVLADLDGEPGAVGWEVERLDAAAGEDGEFGAVVACGDGAALGDPPSAGARSARARPQSCGP